MLLSQTPEWNRRILCFTTPDLSTPAVPKIRDLQECTGSHLNQCIFLNIISKMPTLITNPRIEPTFCHPRSFHPRSFHPGYPQNKRLTRVHRVTFESVQFSEHHIKNSCLYHKTPNGSPYRLAISSKIYMNSFFCVLRKEIIISRNANINFRIRHTILV